MFKYMTVDLEDGIHASEDMNIDALLFFPEAIKFIESALETPGSKVLVHCLEGKSRSSTFTLAFMMQHL